MAWVIGAVVVIVTFWFSHKAGIIVLGTLAAVYVGLLFTAERSDNQLPSTRSVSIAASSNPQLCTDPNAPLAVTFTNHADTTLEEISFSLIARQRGHSSVIYRSYHRSDKTITPGEIYTACYGLNSLSYIIRTERYDPRELDWFGEASLTRFAST